jgi:hypothetical protein
MHYSKCVSADHNAGGENAIVSAAAIMAAALLLMPPRVLAGAILFRPLSPFRADLPTRLDGTT